MGKISIVLVVVVLAVQQVLGSDAFAQQVLDAHNFYRQKHDVPDMTLDPEISAHSQERANQLAENDKLAIEPENTYGENLYWASGKILDGAVPTISWINGIIDYDFAHPTVSSSTAGFTQVVWRATTKLGVGIAESSTGGSYVVVNYDPAGNVEGQYTENVLFPNV